MSLCQENHQPMAISHWENNTETCGGSVIKLKFSPMADKFFKFVTSEICLHSSVKENNTTESTLPCFNDKMKCPQTWFSV